jgi:hypothetical protein
MEKPTTQEELTALLYQITADHLTRALDLVAQIPHTHSLYYNDRNGRPRFYIHLHDMAHLDLVEPNRALWRWHDTCFPSHLDLPYPITYSVDVGRVTFEVISRRVPWSDEDRINAWQDSIQNILPTEEQDYLDSLVYLNHADGDPGEHFMDDDGRPRGYEEEQWQAEMATEAEAEADIAAEEAVKDAWDW